MVAGLYALARRVQPDPLLAACAGFGVLAMLHFHWYLMFHLTNTRWRWHSRRRWCSRS